MTVSRDNYIDTRVKMFHIENNKLHDISMETNLRLKNSITNNYYNRKYRRLIDNMSCISFSVNYASIFQSICNETRYQYALRILKYLARTKVHKLTFTSEILKHVFDCYVINAKS